MSGMTGTGLKKCIPTNRSRRSRATASASRWIAIDEVFEAKIAAAGASASRSRQSADLTARSSKTASMTRSAVGDAAEVGRWLDARQGGVAVRLAEAALGHRPIEVGRDPVAARLGARKVRFVERDRQPDGRMDLRDAVAHQPRASHEDPFDRARHANDGTRTPTVPAGPTARLAAPGTGDVPTSGRAASTGGAMPCQT